MTVAAQAPTTRLRLADGRSLDLWVDQTADPDRHTPLVFDPGTAASGLGHRMVPFAHGHMSLAAAGLPMILDALTADT